MKTTSIKKLICGLFAAILFSTSTASAQRLHDDNIISWNGSFNTIYVTSKVSVWLEYQWRREGFYKNWQQSLPRVGLQYHFNKDVSVMGGYAYIITYPYGDYPIGPYTFPEHRIFEQLVWNDNSHGRLTLNHRLRLEQRLLGKVNQKAAAYDVDGYNYLNRARYQVRAGYPINHKKMEDKTWYVAAFDEILIGFGSNINQNIFDQNRIGVVGGYQFNKMFRFEAGFINQILQQPALYNGKQVYQYNNGLLLSLYFTKAVKPAKS